MARSIVCAIVALGALALAQGQRITTIQLDGVQYFVSRMNPYSPELNYFLAYQYCRSLGLQLTSFESKEKSDSITQYLRNAGYNQYDFWTSGNRLGTDMFLWMSTGLPFNATFDLMNVPADEAAAGQPQDAVVMTSEQPAPLLRRHGSARQSKSGPSSGCVSLKAPDLHWAVDDCTSVKDFICEQTRCYYYNYGSIPVSSSQGRNSKDRPVPVTTTTTASPTIASTTLAPTTTTEAILLDHQDHQDHQDQQAETGNEVPAEEAVGDDAADAATAPPAAAEAVEDAVDDSQPDNSVLAGTDAPPQPTDLPAVPSRARGKYLEQPAAPGGPGGPGVPGSAGGWGWPANIKLEIPVPRRVSGSVGGSV